MEKYNHSLCARQEVSPSVRQSIFSTLERVKRQVEYEQFGREMESRGGKKWLHVDGVYEDCCLIIAEIYVMNPEAVIKVNGAEMNVWIVQEVYGRLTHEHIDLVYSNFKGVTHKIHNKKAYLRTALYNVIFEHDSHWSNEVAKDFGPRP